MTLPMTLVLVAMGVAEPPDRLAALAERHGASVAHLQLADPALRRELDRLADAGVPRIVLVGVAFGIAPGNSWLRRVAAHWWRERPEPPEVVVATGLLDSEDDDLAAVLARARPIAGTEAPLESAAWEEVPAHRHQVLVCRGPRCTARGADDTARALTLALMAAGLGDDDVLVTQTGCQFPCNHAPVVSVQPDDTWYGGVGPDEAERLVETLRQDSPTSREHIRVIRPV
ncbi:MULTISPECIES: (2Fe-2S) ferredoxin domain-containing protein [unclassified Nocardioides]|uniref:(2Fe-2S) ferredoxin domain-containing protein n=1 Tax=unclassified Nocardioides TaxID=2615069 RepID=UPI003014E43D